jgi:hypothetical protein
MAILRGGRRIGPFDIRLGIPRDRSLDNVEGDKRLGRVQGGNPESTIGRVMGQIAQGEGFARPNRFMVDFILPKGVGVQDIGPDDQDFGIMFEEEVQRSTKAGELQANKEVQRGLRAFVESVDMPGRNLDTTDFKVYGPKRQIVTGHSFSGEITMTVYCDKYLRQRSFFEMWQKAAFDQGTNNVHFYDEYTGGLRIYQLGAFAENADRDRISYGVELFECFPKTISAVSYNQGANNDIQRISVSLAFKSWINLTLDQVGNYTVGGGFKAPTVTSRDRGLIGNIINKLPPEIRRAGRDVVNVIRQRVPIGVVTGGRVFPPLL